MCLSAHNICIEWRELEHCYVFGITHRSILAKIASWLYQRDKKSGWKSVRWKKNTTVYFGLSQSNDQNGHVNGKAEITTRCNNTLARPTSSLHCNRFSNHTHSASSRYCSIGNTHQKLWLLKTFYLAFNLVIKLIVAYNVGARTDEPDYNIHTESARQPNHSSIRSFVHVFPRIFVCVVGNCLDL